VTIDILSTPGFGVRLDGLTILALTRILSASVDGGGNSGNVIIGVSASSFAVAQLSVQQTETAHNGERHKGDVRVRTRNR